MKKRLLLGFFLFLAVSLLSVKAADSVDKNQPVMKTAAEVMQERMGYALEAPTPLQVTKAQKADDVGKQKLDSLISRTEFGIISKDIFEFDSKGNHLKHELYEVNASTQKSVLAFSRDLRYDENNYEIERIDKNYDSRGDCFLGTKRNWVINSDGYVIQENNAKLNVATLLWENYSELHYTYDQKGNIIDLIAKAWNSAGNQYVNDSKIEQTFDANQQLASKAFYLWIGNEWVGQTPKYVYNYAYHIDRSDLQTQQEELIWNTSTKSWEDHARQRFVYNENGLVVDYFMEKFIAGSWKAVQYSETVYKDDIYQLSTNVYIANNTGGFDVGVKDTYTFTGIDEETGAHKFVGTREQLLEGSMKKTFDYEFHFIGLLQTVLKEIYAEGTPDMEAQGFEYTYDERGNPTGMTILAYNPSTKEWGYDSKIEQKLYNYDSNKFTESISYSWSNALGDWVARSRTEHKYDVTGTLILSQTGGYTSGTWVVSSGQRTILDYDVPISGVIMPNPVREGSTWEIGHKLLKMEQLSWDEEGPYATQWMDAYYTNTNISAIDKVAQNNSVYAYNNTLYVNTPNAETVNVYTVDGILVKKAQKVEGAATIDISTIAKGLYVVKGTTGWGVKIIK